GSSGTVLAITQSQPITAAGLALLGTGTSWTLTNASNDIATLAANTGALSYRDANTYAVGVAGAASTTGITSSSNVTLNAGSTRTLSQPITTTGTGAVSLTSAADIVTTSAGDITSAAAATLFAAVGITAAGDVTASGAVSVTASSGALSNTGAI